MRKHGKCPIQLLRACRNKSVIEILQQEENRVAKNEELENIRQQLMNAQMHITELEQAGAKYRDLINEQQKEIAELKMKSAVNNPVTDEIPVLRAQVNHNHIRLFKTTNIHFLVGYF